MGDKKKLFSIKMPVSCHGLMVHVIGLLFILSFMLQGLNGLSCVICTSYNDENCTTSPELMERKECSQWCGEGPGFNPRVTKQNGVLGEPVVYPETKCPYSGQFATCRKIVTTVKRPKKEPDLVRVYRQCGFIGTNTQPVSTHKKNGDGSRVDVYNCFKNDCNTAATVPAGFVNLSIFLGISLYISRIILN